MDASILGLQVSAVLKTNTKYPFSLPPQAMDLAVFFSFLPNVLKMQSAAGASAH